MVYNTSLIVAISISCAQIPQQQVNASTLGDLGNNADTGYDAGRIAGYNDRQNGQEHDSKCPPNDSLVWCGAFKVGYEAGWFSSGTV